MNESKVNSCDDADYRRLSDAACRIYADSPDFRIALDIFCFNIVDVTIHKLRYTFPQYAGENEFITEKLLETTNPPKENKARRVHGMNCEDTTDTEGTVTFDIRFYAVTPTKERVKLIINVEAQNDFYPGYPLIKRAIFYGCRQISAQYGIEFEHSHYEDIKKVYSIWVCFDPPQYRHNTITAYGFGEKQIVGEVHENKANYDLMSTIMICLGNKEDERYNGLLKLLDVWLSRNSIDEKRAALKDIFDAEMPQRLLEKEVNMCNYSDFVENRGRKEGRKESKTEDLVNLMKNFKLGIDEALKGLSIPESEWDEYRRLVAALEAHPVV